MPEGRRTPLVNLRRILAKDVPLVAASISIAVFAACAVIGVAVAVSRPDTSGGVVAGGVTTHIGDIDEVDERRVVVVPDVVKGIYLTSATVGHARRFGELVEFAERSGVNTLVIDIKNWRGELAFTTENEELAPFVSARPEIRDLHAMTAMLKEKGLYLVARQFVFQDPAYAEARPATAVKWPDGSLWRDNKGIPWIDPASREAWAYNVAVAREAFDAGFDEIQFDYIRFPSDGRTSSIVYPFYDRATPKHEVMRDFFVYLDEELRQKHGIPISVDLFGFTMVHHDYDLNIGQLMRDALPHFDYVSPMVYPSHYPAGYLGYANPAAYPYEVVAENMKKGNELYDRMRLAEAASADADSGVSGAVAPQKLATVRPWLQDFHLGATYTPEMVRAQMRAAMEGGASGWIFWNARNVYTESAYND